MDKQALLFYPLLGMVLLELFVGELAYGAIPIPLDHVMDILLGKGSGKIAQQNIVLQSHLPQAITALLAEASLTTSGLLLQTLFRNLLTGPSILGISDNANLGVVTIMLYFDGTLGQSTDWPISGYMAVILVVFVEACVILGLIIYFSAKVKNNVMLLIIGVMIDYLTSSVISILNYCSPTDRVHALVMWGLGNSSGIPLGQLPFFGTYVLVELLLTVLLIEPLNALLLGEMYTANLDIRIERTRIVIPLYTGILAATTTAFCDPIPFIGLTVPHIAWLMLGSSNHKMLVPVIMLTSSCVALLRNMLMVVPGSNTILPLNAVIPILGALVIIYVIMNRKNIQYFS